MGSSLPKIWSEMFGRQDCFIFIFFSINLWNGPSICPKVPFESRAWLVTALWKMSSISKSKELFVLFWRSFVLKLELLHSQLAFAVNNCLEIVLSLGKKGSSAIFMAIYFGSWKIPLQALNKYKIDYNCLKSNSYIRLDILVS